MKLFRIQDHGNNQINLIMRNCINIAKEKCQEVQKCKVKKLMIFVQTMEKELDDMNQECSDIIKKKKKKNNPNEHLS